MSEAGVHGEGEADGTDRILALVAAITGRLRPQG